MRKFHFVGSILFIAALLSGCASLQMGESRASGNDPKLTDDPPVPASTQAPAAEVEAGIPPSDCPITRPGEVTFEAPEPFSNEAPWKGFFWHGSMDLWTVLPMEGGWAELPLNPEGYTQKIFWWSDKFVLKDEPLPALVVSGRRLDEEAPPLKFYGATNAFAGDIGEAMLTGVDFPTHGCWKVTGQYRKAELSFVVWIAP